MTQPSTINKTFDASLVDVQRSFSSTETNTSGSSAKDDTEPLDKPREPSPYETVPTDQLYEHWASTYDTDGNVLQAVDDLQLRNLLPEFVRLTCQNDGPASNGSGCPNILDFGCGTGRNTVKLLRADWEKGAKVSGWDGSAGMLEIAHEKCNAAQKTLGTALGTLEVRDLAHLASVPDHYSGFFDGLISTLVLEHITAHTFFGIIENLLKPGCYALITNMHSEMGMLSRAGFKTTSGERFKATSYIITPAETVGAANSAGLEVVGEVIEAAVQQNLIDGGVVDGVRIEKGAVNERARKWIGTKVWYGMILRKR